MDQINIGIETHLKLGVMQAIVHSPDAAYQKEKDALQANWGSRNIEMFFERTKRFWGCLQRDEHAVQNIQYFVEEDIFKFQGSVDSVLIPPVIAM